MVWSTTLRENSVQKKRVPNHKQDWTANKHLRDAQPKTGPEVDSPQKYPALDTHAPATHPTHTRRQHRLEASLRFCFGDCRHTSGTMNIRMSYAP